MSKIYWRRPPRPGDLFVFSSQNHCQPKFLTAGQQGDRGEDQLSRDTHKLIAKYREPDFINDPILNRAGGQWCDVPLGQCY